ncbi:hypothetical protein OLQ90_03830 [Campylobacter jejuni]|nr:hypothetical protein [Campylobacter jejuni]
MKDDKTLLPQKSQFGDKFWLIRDDLAVCENGRIFDYDDLGKLIETQYECILDNISKASCKKNSSKYNRFKKISSLMDIS